VKFVPLVFTRVPPILIEPVVSEIEAKEVEVAPHVNAPDTPDKSNVYVEITKFEV
jgi:hypothetical protein